MKMPRLWDIVKRFKESCRFRGWKTSENEDWVEINDKYHNFLFIKDIPVSSFKRVMSNRKCIVKEGLSYRVVDASYTAWLLSEAPSENLVKTIFESPDFSKRIALYDLSPMLEGKNLCVKLNFTDSPVFHEFESFLKTEMKIKLKPLFNREFSTADYTVAELA